MFFLKNKPSTPVFLWIVLITTTLLLALIIFVYRAEIKPADPTVIQDYEPTVVEKKYVKDVRSLVQEYEVNIEDLKLPEDQIKMKNSAEEMHQALISFPVPPIMQTLHLSLVLDAAQIVAILEVDLTDNTQVLLDELSEEVFDITEALK